MKMKHGVVTMPESLDGSVSLTQTFITKGARTHLSNSNDEDYSQSYCPSKYWLWLRCFSALVIVTMDTITRLKYLKETKYTILKDLQFIYIRITSPVPNIPITDSGAQTVVLWLSARYTVEMWYCTCRAVVGGQRVIKCSANLTAKCDFMVKHTCWIYMLLQAGNAS